eukprot:UN29999
MQAGNDTGGQPQPIQMGQQQPQNQAIQGNMQVQPQIINTQTQPQQQIISQQQPNQIIMGQQLQTPQLQNQTFVKFQNEQGNWCVAPVIAEEPMTPQEVTEKLSEIPDDPVGEVLYDSNTKSSCYFATRWLWCACCEPMYVITTL